ncbi:right-handed parallel beta-helix repeat-containing protein [Algoriphagus limi]|uniref:Right-handed parallel beta-helix repeat-containing protein n=1 Tax=Algoriphagus limi TaxID=2975273 RepID=A0ABT2G7S5_9BACT|nr:right-handed parallel beta-helix repeat-containing protein [Algoriphagus limi]MCS5491329.1 right-handed parallel beta-helix repeat-containing protein [Algoriphagus limi]
MKKLIFPLLAILFLASCTNEDIVPIEKIDSQNFSTKKVEMSTTLLEQLSREFDEFRATNEVRKQKAKINGKKVECTETVFVPDDYPTIQEAIFAVCENGKVFVRSGTYYESPGTETPGIFIKAIGDVTLKGGFGLGADNVKIHGFKIDNAYSYWGPKVGIASAPGFNGFDIKHNTIYSTETNNPYLPFGHIGIYFGYCDNAIIAHNNISGNMEVGIFIDAVVLELPGSPPQPFRSSINNTISNNTITGIFGDLNVLYPGSGIVLRCADNNRVQGNNIDTTNGWGIRLIADFGQSCDGNIVKNNSVKNTLYDGIGSYFGGNGTIAHNSNNTIGPNNESNNNGESGIYLDEYSLNNIVFNNTAKNNSLCDIVNEGTDNTFKNNSSDCAIGID